MRSGMIKNMLYAAAMVLMVVACAPDKAPWSFKSADPYDGYPDSIKNGIPPGKDPSGGEGAGSSALLIDSPDYLGFTEGRDDTYAIVGRILLNVPGELVLEGLPDWANWDATKGEITGRPPSGLGGTDLIYRKNVRAILKTTRAPFLQIEKDIPIFVSRGFRMPEVLGVKNLTVVKEGDKIEFQVSVKEPDSDAMTAPKLVVTGQVLGGGKIPQLVSFSTKPPTPGTTAGVPTWTYTLEFNTLDEKGQQLELTKGELKTYNLVFNAYNRFGVPSPEFIHAITVKNAAKVPRVSFGGGNIDFSAGNPNVFAFQGFDPSVDGAVTVTSVTNLNDLPGRPTLSCSNSTGISDCKLNWTPTAGTNNDFDITFKVQNKGPTLNDISEAQFTKRFSVQ